MSNKLSELQKSRLHNLEQKLDKCLLTRDFETAKLLVLDIQNLLRPLKKYPRLYQSKNKLIELAIELNLIEFAITQLNAARRVLKKNTRGYLEASALLAICYLRNQSIPEAKLTIKEVLSNESVIKSEKSRNVFHTEIINRFNEEIALCSLKSDFKASLDEQNIEEEAIKLLTSNSEKEIFTTLGRNTPSSTKDLIYIIHDFSTKQLTSKERLALPSPVSKVEDCEVGITIYQAIKRVLYNSICNPESDIYKAWYNNGLELVLSKNYIKSTVIACCIDLGIGIPMIIASVIALITKFGIEVFCETNKPKYILEFRKLN